jgi:hypothetical protein
LLPKHVADRSFAKDTQCAFSCFAEPFKESESPKKWVQPATSNRFAVTSDGLRTLLVVGGQPVPLSPSASPGASPALSPSRSPMAGSPSRSPMHGGALLGTVGSFSNILLSSDVQDLRSHQHP